VICGCETYSCKAAENSGSSISLKLSINSCHMWTL